MHSDSLTINRLIWKKKLLHSKKTAPEAEESDQRSSRVSVFNLFKRDYEHYDGVPKIKIMKSIKSIFKVDETIGVSKFRFYLLRFFYLVNALLLGISVWTEIFTRKGLWEPLQGVAFSFWAAFSTLAILGVLYPLKMIPLLLVQFSYKLIWLIIVAYPLWSANHLTGSSAQGLSEINFKGIVVDLIVIPWSYVLKNYILKPKKNK